MLKSFFVGLSYANRSGKMILLLVVANILFTFPIVTPILLVIVTTGNGHNAAERLLDDKLYIHWLTDLFNHQFAGASVDSTAAQVGTLLVVMGGLYLLLNTLFAGGILEIFHSGHGRFTMRAFWMGCGEWFWRFFRLMLLSLVFYGIAYSIFKLISAPISSSAETAVEYAPIFYKRWAANLGVIVLFAFVNMVFDYAKIGAVVKNSRGMLQETINAFRFSLQRLSSATALYGVIAMIGIAVFVFFAGVRNSIPQRSGGGVFLAMLIGQMAIAGRMWTRLNFYASELDLYKRFASVQAVAPMAPSFEFAPAFPAPLVTERAEALSSAPDETEISLQPEPEKL